MRGCGENGERLHSSRARRASTTALRSLLVALPAAVHFSPLPPTRAAVAMSGARAMTNTEMLKQQTWVVIGAHTPSTHQANALARPAYMLAPGPRQARTSSRHSRR